MFEVGLPIFIYLVDSIASGIYVQKFLREKYQKKLTLIVWTSLFFIIQSLLLERIDSTYPLYVLIGVLADIAFVLLLQLLLYHKDLLKPLFVAVSFVAGKRIIRYIIGVLINILFAVWDKVSLSFTRFGWITSIEDVQSWCAVANVIIEIIIGLLYVFLIIIYLSAIEKRFIRKEYQYRAHEYIFLILPSVVTLCISITLRMMILFVENGIITTTIYEKVPATMFWIPLICILLLGVNISSIILFQKLVLLGEEERKRAILENQMIQMQREIEEIQEIYADMRGLRHDMRSHLESIAAVVRRTSENDREELDDYIGEMEATVNRLDFAYRTGNPITDIIIHQKKQEAEKRNITFKADFTYPDKQQIDVYDIGIILNNALENAIEASSKLEGKKQIRLCSYMKGNLYFIEIENDFSGELALDSETGLPISSKEDKRLHGVGMENIQRCAKKYKGDIDITIRDVEDRKMFSLTIMMYEK